MSEKALTKTALDNFVRESAFETLKQTLTNELGEEVVKVGGNVMAYPTVDKNGNEAWVEITVKVPKGERLSKEDGGGYGGYVR